MKRKDLRYIMFSVALSSMVLLSGCNKYDTPPTIWNPGASYATGASIASVTPANTAVAGVREITVLGKFADSLNSNWIYIGSQTAMVKKFSKGAAIDTLVLYRPPVTGTVEIKIVVPNADSIAKVPYTLESPSTPFDISGINITGTPCFMDLDKNGTIWIAYRGYIYRESPDGLGLPAQYKDTSYLKPRIRNAASAFSRDFADMKFGPGGFMYATFVSINNIYCMHPDSATPYVYATLAANQTQFFDFDDNGNIYTGKSAGIFLVRPAVPRTATAVGDYSGQLVEVRVIKEASGDKYVYVATTSTLYKSKINSDGTLQPKVTVTDVNVGGVAGNDIRSFNVDAAGNIYFSLRSSTTQVYSLYIRESNGQISPYYMDNIVRDNVLTSGIDRLIWGNDRSLYLNRATTGLVASTRLFKVGMLNNGAPYLGRGL
ncbi:MAG: hypothetical protein EHM64_05775 [Ignavibacteriae bacterium]|nr:MAG: hypothetical protein EHM64_05775 [Ignavibacteriota bacterium]